MYAWCACHRSLTDCSKALLQLTRVHRQKHSTFHCIQWQLSMLHMMQDQHSTLSWVTCRWGPTGQGKLLCDIHSALIRVLEGLDEDLMEAPTMAGYGSATDLAPQDAYRPLLGASWPELACRYLQEHSALTISQEAVDAVVRLKANISRTAFVACTPCLADSLGRGGSLLCCTTAKSGNVAFTVRWCSPWT